VQWGDYEKEVFSAYTEQLDGKIRDIFHCEHTSSETSVEKRKVDKTYKWVLQTLQDIMQWRFYVSLYFLTRFCRKMGDSG
jgi:hypothetical protein